MSIQELALDDMVSRAEAGVGTCAEALAQDEPRVTGYVEFGIPLTSRAVARRDDLAEVTEWLRQPRRYEGTGVLLDNTTIVTLTSLLEGERLSPLTLWDLARAVTALITYDNIFHFENPEVDDNALNARLGQDAFRPLSLPDPGPLYDPAGVRELFNDAWESTHSLMARLEASVGAPTLEGLEIKALVSQWSLALGRPLKAADVVNAELSGHEWRSPGGALLAELWRNTGLARISDNPMPGQGLDNLQNILGTHPGARDVLGRFIREGNYRGSVNQRVAVYLRLPYMPNMARIPFQNRFWDRARAVSERLPSIFELDKRYAENAAQYQRYSGPPFALPVFLALAVRDAIVPEDLWGAIAGLRQHACRYRERRANLDWELEQGNRDVLDSTLKAVSTEAAKLTTLLTEAARASGDSLVTSVEANPVSFMSGNPLPWLTTGLGALIAGTRKLVPGSVADRLMWRMFRPEFRFLSDIASQSRAINNSMPAIQRLWGLPDSQISIFQDRYKNFAAFQPPLRL